jgi:HK97 family phage prohead protease
MRTDPFGNIETAAVGPRWESRDAAVAHMERAGQRLKDHPQCERCRRQPSTIARGTRDGYQAVCRACGTAADRIDRERLALDRELRALARTDLEAREQELRALEGGDDRQARQVAAGRWLAPGLIGYALLWSDQCRRDEHGGYVETFDRHAFDRLPHVRCLINHDDAREIGHTADGSLRLTADARGLQLKLTPRNTAAGRDILDQARAGRVTGASVSYWPERSEIRVARPPLRRRTVLRCALSEVSIVVAPKRPGYARSWMSLWTPDADRRLGAEQIAACEAELDALAEDL